MEDIKPISDTSLHENEKVIDMSKLESDSFGARLGIESSKNNLPYEPIKQTELDNTVNKLNDELTEFKDKTGDNYVDVKDRPVDDKEELFYKNLNAKYQAYVDNIQDVKQENHKTVKLPWFRETRKKFASNIFDAKMKASDIAGNCHSYRRAVDGNYYEHLDWTQENTLRHFFNNKLRLNALQVGEFYTFKNVWKLVKLILITRITVAKNKIYTLLAKLVRHKDYYGYDSLEEMMDSTGGLPYDTLLSNHGIDPDCMNYIKDDDGNIINIKKEMLKKKFSAKFPTSQQEFENLFDKKDDDEDLKKVGEKLTQTICPDIEPITPENAPECITGNFSDLGEKNENQDDVQEKL